MTRRLRFVLYPGFQLLDAAGPIAAFEEAEHLCPGSYRCELFSRKGGLLVSSSGVALSTRRFAQADALSKRDTLFVVGGYGVDEARKDRALLAFLRDQAAQAGRLASVCSGSFLYAQAGLLTGRTVTTHWRRGQDFRLDFPDVMLDPDRIYIQDGRVWSSAGISAGIDLALALIAADLGEDWARQVARLLVVYFHRPGGQSQFSALSEMAHGDRFAELLDYARTHLRQPLGVAELAERACMSPRHFARRFTQDTGCPPAQAIERLRVEAAALALETGASVQVAARDCGFTSPERMRRAFLRQRGVPPSALQRGG